MSHDDLTDLERAVLDFEQNRWKYAGAKETAIRETFGWSATRHYQLLNDLIDQSSAMAYDPMTVKRLQRIREARRQARSSRRLLA